MKPSNKGALYQVCPAKIKGKIKNIDIYGLKTSPNHCNFRTSFWKHTLTPS